MKTCRTLILVLAMAFCMASCTKTEKEEEQSLSVSPISLTFSKEGGSQPITINSSGNWTSSTVGNWIKLNPGSGSSTVKTVEVTVSSNMEEAREGTITIASGIRTAVVKISQEAGYADDDIKKVSIAEFRRLKDSETDWYRLTGEVVSISKVEYGDLYLLDDTGYVYVYGLAPEKGGVNEDFAKAGIKAGDRITIVAQKKTYNGIIETDQAYLEARQAGSYPGINADKAQAGFIELPATSERDGLTYVCHFDNKGKRNYSAYFDREKKVSNWVCYPYCSSDRNDARPDSYAYDPLLENDCQADLTKSYQKRNFDGEEFVRGHMMPSASRSGRRQLDAFLATNIMPQSSAINTGIWSSLEEKERFWVNNCDTLYIVVGTDCSQSKYQVEDNAEPAKKITVPNGIYRAVLAYDKEKGSYVGIAAYFENKKNAYTDFTKTLPETMLMSIDKLEEKVGIDFFVNLPSVVGESEAKAIEAADPASEAFWWN